MKKIILISLILTFSFLISVDYLVAEGITPSEPKTNSSHNTVILTNPLGDNKTDIPAGYLPFYCRAPAAKSP